MKSRLVKFNKILISFKSIIMRILTLDKDSGKKIKKIRAFLKHKQLICYLFICVKKMLK